MNKYGEIAQRRWRAMSPESYEQIADPREFFSTLGEQIESLIGELEDEIAGPDPVGEGYLEKVGRLNMARLQAEEIALEELIPVEPIDEDEETPDPVGVALRKMHDELTAEMELEEAIRSTRRTQES